MRRFAVLDRAVEPRLAFLEGHLDADLLVIISALPGAEPARGALGAGHARPDVVDRRAEGSGENEIVAAEAAGGVRVHAVFLFVVLVRDFSSVSCSPTSRRRRTRRTSVS